MNLRRTIKWAAATGILAIAAIPAHADVIDFEAGFVDLAPVGAVATATNTVTFSVTGGGTGFIAAVGAPVTAFVSGDTPAGGAGGSFFLTDETAGPSAALDYMMVFAKPVLDLSLLLYDYRVDGGPAAGDTATLTVYSDAAFGAALGTSVFTIPAINPVDGNAELLSIAAVGPILSATVIMSTPDVGTGIDNITFTTKVPEPVSLLLLGLGLIGIGATRRRA